MCPCQQPQAKTFKGFFLLVSEVLRSGGAEEEEEVLGPAPHLGTPGQVHHSVNEALGGGGSGKAECVRPHSFIHLLIHHLFLILLWVQNSIREATIRPAHQNPWEGEQNENISGPEARNSAPD